MMEKSDWILLSLNCPGDFVIELKRLFVHYGSLNEIGSKEGERPYLRNHVEIIRPSKFLSSSLNFYSGKAKIRIVSVCI